MRVLQVSPTYAPLVGGLESYLESIVAHLSREAAVLVATGTPDPGAPSDDPAVLRCTILGEERLAHRTATDGLDTALAQVIGAELEKIVDGFCPDVVHFHNAHHFGPELAHAAVALRDRARVVLTAHDHTGRLVCPETLDLPWDSVIYVSDFLRRSLPSSRRWSILSPGVDLEIFNPHCTPDPALSALESPRVFHPARLLRWKGVSDSLEAFLLLRDQIGTGSLILCGSTQIADDSSDVTEFRAELQSRADDAGAGRQVHFVTAPYAGMPAAYAAADLVWYPTREDEPFGLVPLEANACGRPVVVTDSGGMAETIRDGVNGLMVPRGSPESLAKASHTVLATPSLREQLVLGGYREVQRFSMENHTRLLEQHYEELMRA